VKALSLSLVLVVAAGCGGQHGSAGVTEAQARAIESALHLHPGWRAATAADHTGNVEEVRRIRDTLPTYNPHFATTTVGRTESAFAVALIRDTTFLVLYFPFRVRGYGTPVEAARAAWLREAYLSLRGDTLQIAAYHSDVIFDLVWNGTSGAFQLIGDSSEASGRKVR
jgi:hypothetical protein